MRAALTLTAALVTAWLALMTFNQWRGDRASDDVLSQPKMSQADYERDVRTLGDSQLLDPGTNWTLLQASALVLRDRARAQRVAESVFEREPENIEALRLILNSSHERDPERFTRGVEQRRRLDPAAQRR